MRTWRCALFCISETAGPLALSDLIPLLFYSSCRAGIHASLSIADPYATLSDVQICFALALGITTVSHFCGLLLCPKSVPPTCGHPCGLLLQLFPMFIACGPLIWLKQDLLRSTE